MVFFLIASAMAIAVPATEQERQIDVGCGGPSINGATLEHLRSMPTGAWTVVPKEAVVHPLANTGEPLGYTRIRIQFRPCPGANERHYAIEKRSFLKRKFLGKHLEKSFSLSIKLSPTDVGVSPTLISVKRDSDSKGEKWATTSDNGNIPTPYFRIDRGSTVVLTPQILSKRDYNSEIGSGLIELITQASAAIAPKVPLITSENKKRFNDAAAFVDSQINSLLHVDIDEKTIVEADLNPGNQEQVLAIYSVWLPFANDVYGTSLHPIKPVGVWTVIAEPLRASMLGTTTTDHLAAAKLSPAAVLGFKVDSNKTVREALSGSQDVIAARDELVKAHEPETGDKAYRLCRLIQSQVEKLEMMTIDGAAVSWAYVKDLALTPKVENQAVAGCSRIGNFPS